MHSLQTKFAHKIANNFIKSKDYEKIATRCGQEFQVCNK